MISEQTSGRTNGYLTSLSRRFLSLKELTLLLYSPALLTKPYGREKVFLLIECLLRTPLLSTTALDTHLLLILNYKDSLGSRVRKAVICKSSNSVKRDGPRRLRWPYLTVRSLWLRLSVKKLMPFSIPFSAELTQRRVSFFSLNLELMILKLTPNSDFIYSPRCRTLTISLK